MCSTRFTQLLRENSLAVSVGNKENKNNFEKFAWKKTLRETGKLNCPISGSGNNT